MSLKQCRTYLSNYENNVNKIDVLDKNFNKTIIEISNGYFRYTKNSNDILKNFNLEIRENEFLAIVGGNGSGKTTLLNILSGLNRIYKGKFRLNGKKLKEFKGPSLYRNNISYLPQSPENLFLKNTVWNDLLELTKIINLSKESGEKLVNEIIDLIELDRELLSTHPYDLSGGEQQKVAFCKVMILQPKIILLDEPTKGLDSYSKKVFAKILKKLLAEGKTIIMVSHDIEFIAHYADRCGMLFDGGITSIENTNKFFSNNLYYTTSAHKISSDFYNNAITSNDVIKLCKINGKNNAI